MLTVESVIVRVIVHHGKAVDEDSPDIEVPDWERICRREEPDLVEEETNQDLRYRFYLGGLALMALGFWGLIGWLFVRVLHLWK